MEECTILYVLRIVKSESDFVSNTIFQPQHHMEVKKGVIVE
jgi:hypothetical protein